MIKYLPNSVDNLDEFLVCFPANIFSNFSLNYYKTKV